jgi:micrococcal nuclease
MKKEFYLLVLLFFLLIGVNYSFLDTKLKSAFEEDNFGIVERIIDGDTIVINGTSVRLLGINCPEKKEEFFTEAKEFLEKEILNKTIKLEFGKDKTDRYGRTLAYVFLERKNINLALVEQGLANPYFPSGKDKYSSQFYGAWKNCKTNLCIISEDECANCIKLKKFDYLKEEMIFENICSFDCDLTGWKIKDEGRKNFVFGKFVLEKFGEIKVAVNGKGDIVWGGETYVWTKTGDTLFLRDDKNRLILFETY